MSLSGDQLVEIAALTTQHINKTMPDLYMRANALYGEMLKRKVYVPGGKKIQLPMFGISEIGTQGFITGTSADTLDLNQERVMTYGELDWKFFYYALTFSLDELTKTEDSPHAIKSFVKQKVGFAQNSMVRTLSDAVYNSASGDTNVFNGFGDIFAASGTAYAGVTDTTDVTNWLPYYPSDIAATNYTNLSPVLDVIKSRTSQIGSSQSIDGTMSTKKILILSDFTEYTNFKNAEQLKLRFTPGELMKTGFVSINVDGCDWVADTYCGTKSIYVLSTDSMEMFYRYGFGKNSPLDTKTLRVPNQPTTSQINFLAGNMGCTNRRVNAKVDRT